jgi:hypothetical protein
MAGYQQGQANRMQGDAENAYRQQAQDWMQNMPLERTEVEQLPPEVMGPPQTQVIKPTRGQVLQHAMAGIDNPFTKELASGYMSDQLIKAPEREAAREEARNKREDEQAFRSEERAAREATLREMQKERLAQDKALKEQTNELRKQGMLLQYSLGQQRLADQRARHGDSQNKLSASELKDLDEQTSMNTSLDTAIKAGTSLGDKKENVATGYAKGLVQEYLPGGEALVAATRSGDMNNYIQNLTYVADAIRHARFGSALTAREASSAAQYLPSPFDSTEARQRKAKGLQSLLERNRLRLQAKAAGMRDYMKIGVTEGDMEPKAAEATPPKAATNPPVTVPPPPKGTPTSPPLKPGEVRLIGE